MVLAGEAATQALAARIAPLARPGDVIALAGDLGSGKTVFARAFIHALGAAEEVPSPTFTLVQTYELSSGTVYHFDLYRLEDSEEAVELGIEDAFADGISLIEWPDRLGPFLPGDRLSLEFSHGEDAETRHVRIGAGGDWPDRLAGSGFHG
jgi:tRNA threonylcarbamoyladenosine biosynthesis protein TsaE